jgi:hypothetical protein
MELNQNRVLRPLPSSDELLVLEYIVGACMHRTWSMAEHSRTSYATCDLCGEQIVAMSEGWEHEATPEEVKERFLRLLPRPGQDELYANTLVRKVEAAGWQFNFSKSGDVIACSLSNGPHSFRSGPHKYRCKAILNVLVELVRSGHYKRQ